MKISPKKCQLFRSNLNYMGNEIFIQNKRVCVKPLSKLEAVQKLQPPTTVKGCRSFAGMINFLSMFCPELQKLLKPIYDLTRKSRPLIWGKEQQDLIRKLNFSSTRSILLVTQAFASPLDMAPSWLQVDWRKLVLPVKIDLGEEKFSFLMYIKQDEKSTFL